MVHAERRLILILALASALLLLLGMGAGSEGLRIFGGDAPTRAILWDIRAPRTLGAWLVGGLFGLAGAIAQGVFRNPLADPYLLGSASGASLAVVAVLALGALVPSGVAASSALLLGSGVAAFVGALAGVALTLLLARGTEHSTRLLLAGVVVGVLLGALAEGLILVAPQALRGRQSFMLGSTGLISWEGVALAAGALALALARAWRYAPSLDALVLGEDTAQSLGLPVAAHRRSLMIWLALATGVGVALAGLIAFVGLVAPHLVRRLGVVRHGALLPASGVTGGLLLLSGDVLARTVIAPRELPVGILTAVLGGVYLLHLLHRDGKDG